MGRRVIDPIVTVLDYFEKAELGNAKQAQALVNEVMRRRAGVPKPVAKKKPLASALASSPK